MTFNYRAIYTSFRGAEFILLAAAGWDVEIYDQRMDRVDVCINRKVKWNHVRGASDCTALAISECLSLDN